MPNLLDMVTQDDSQELSPFDVAKMRGISIRPTTGADVASAGNDPLTRMVAPEPPTDIMAIIQQVKDRLLGTGGQERYQMWPERMVRSGLTLPGDVMSGAEPMLPPGLRREDFTDAQKPGGFTVVAQPGDTVRERAQDVAGLAGGSALIERPGAGTLGSGALRPGAKVVPVEPAPVFYSALEHAATNAAQETMSPQQWLGYLKNQPGVKQEELQWTGIGDWLGQQKGKVSKKDVQAYLDEHKIEIKDVTKKSNYGEGDDAVGNYIDEHHERLSSEAEREVRRAEPELEKQDPSAYADAIEDAITQIADDEMRGGIGGGGDVTKYSSYQLSGGENYREHLLTMPSKPADMARNAAGLVDNPVSPDYRSSHWDEPNVLAHVRTNDRVMGATPIADIEAKVAKAYSDTKPEHMASGMVPRAVQEGVLTPQEAADWSRARGFITGYKKGEGFEGQPGTGKKSLHIEEIQSDWHQQGRKQGYKGEIPPEHKALIAERDKLAGEVANIQAKPDLNNSAVQRSPGYTRDPEWIQRMDRITEINKQIDQPYGLQQGVPDAPFKTTWPELALKRMIRHAAENGYDRISWTPGEAQAARYDLSRSFDKVGYVRNPDKTYSIEGFNDRGGVHDFGSKIAEDKLADYVGKDLAEKIVGNKDKTHEYSGVDLKVGGEGMREFYDKMLPKMAEKIGKAHGVKVKKHRIPDGSPEYDTHQGAEPLELHYFDLPQSLKDHAVGRGFPLYMSGVPFPLTPVDHDPFKERK